MYARGIKMCIIIGTARTAQHCTMIALVTGGLHFKSSLSEPALLLIRLFQKMTSPCVVTLRRTFTAQSDMLAPSITRWLEVGGTPVTSQRGRRALRIHRSHAWIFFFFSPSLFLVHEWLLPAPPPAAPPPLIVKSDATEFFHVLSQVCVSR